MSCNLYENNNIGKFTNLSTLPNSPKSVSSDRKIHDLGKTLSEGSKEIDRAVDELVRGDLGSPAFDIDDYLLSEELDELFSNIVEEDIDFEKILDDIFGDDYFGNLSHLKYDFVGTDISFTTPTVDSEFSAAIAQKTQIILQNFMLRIYSVKSSNHFNSLPKEDQCKLRKLYSTIAINKYPGGENLAHKIAKISATVFDEQLFSKAELLYEFKRMGGDLNLKNDENKTPLDLLSSKDIDEYNWFNKPKSTDMSTFFDFVKDEGFYESELDETDLNNVMLVVSEPVRKEINGILSSEEVQFNKRRADFKENVEDGLEQSSIDEFNVFSKRRKECSIF